MTPAAGNTETGRPATVTVHDIGVESVLQPLGLNDDGSLEVPAPGSRYDEAGWFTGSPRPGEVGPAVLLGHVNGIAGAPSVFYRLAELRAGHRVTVTRDDGSQAVFEVYRVEQYPKNSFPSAAVYGDTTGPELRLITCAGTWDPGTGHYRDNTVVYAQIVSGT
ncbi:MULTISPECIES: class F sortase [unclassified Ornithinimicrobium]|uniref:class F sortase n=1 Tax=unclassified Ornithinimicrobium TaxID=2615080 RepID=UPI003853DB98